MASTALSEEDDGTSCVELGDSVLALSDDKEGELEEKLLDDGGSVGSTCEDDAALLLGAVLFEQAARTSRASATASVRIFVAVCVIE